MFFVALLWFGICCLYLANEGGRNKPNGRTR